MCRLSRRAQDFARANGLFEAIHANFETNGEANLGRQEAAEIATWYSLTAGWR
jgi:hypothetical protein